MLYPLSYEGARAQSSDLGVHLGWQGVAHVHPRHPAPCSPSPGPHPEHTNPVCDRRSAPVTRVGTGSPWLASAGEHTPRTSPKIM